MSALFDQQRYPMIAGSHAGGALAGSQVLVVLPKSVWERRAAVKTALQLEQCEHIAFLPAEQLSVAQIEQLTATWIGPFDHILNIFSAEGAALLAEGEFNNDDALHALYSTLQCETGYLVQYDRPATITSAFIYDTAAVEPQTMAASAQHLIKGLSRPLSNHQLIANGLTATTVVPFEEVLHTMLFLASKYGQLLAGETLKLQ